MPEAVRRLMSLGDHVIVSYTSRERDRIEPHLEPYCDARTRRFYPFVESTKFGFTVAHLSAAIDHAGGGDRTAVGAHATLARDGAYA